MVDPDFARAWEREAQALADDASGDHCYVGGSPPELPVLLAIHSAPGLPASEAWRALQQSMAQTVRMWRANGGVGRAVVSLSPDGVALIEVLRSPQDELDWAKRRFDRIAA